MRRIPWVFFLLATMLVLPLSGPAAAQNTPVIDQLQVDLWPEYDRPDVLVIYHITLSPQTNLPARITLSLPPDCGGPFNLAMKDSDGLLYNLTYDQPVKSGEWLKVSFSTPSTEIQLEYYDSNLTRSDTQRSFEYRWPGDYEVNSMTIQVQQPAGATQMQITPPMGSGRLAADNFTYFTEVVGKVATSTPVLVRLSYHKASNALSSTSIPLEPVVTVSADTPGRTTFDQVLPWILVASGVLFMGGGAIWYWQYVQQGSTQPRKRHEKASTNKTTSSKYCPKCGRPVVAGDAYCRSCGARLHSE